MVSYPFTVKLPDFDLFSSAVRQAVDRAVEAEARLTLNELRSQWLDAPEGFSADRLHRRTGNLADTAFVGLLEKMKWAIRFPAPYAIVHHGEGTRDVFVQPFKRDGKKKLRRIAKSIRSVIQ